MDVRGETMTRTTHFVSLDWLRGLAALLILALHFELSASSTKVFSHGYLAVDLFFLLSGFVIAKSYEPLMRRPGGGRDFAVTRFIRLYPLALLGSLVGILTWLIGKFDTHHILVVIFCQIMLIPQLWQGSTLFLLNSVHWSLMLEVLANLVHALSIRRLTTSVIAVVVLLGWCGLLASAWYWGSLSGGYARTNAVEGVARVIFGYASGVLLQRLHAAGRMPRWRIAPALVLPFPLLLLVPGIPALDRLWFADVVIVTLLPLLLVVALNSDIPVRFHRTARALGQLSYPLYAIHLPLVMTGVGAVGLFGLTGAIRVAALGMLAAAVIALSLIAQYSYDAPVRRWLTRHLHARLIRTPAATAP